VGGTRCERVDDRELLILQEIGETAGRLLELGDDLGMYRLANPNIRDLAERLRQEPHTLTVNVGLPAPEALPAREPWIHTTTRRESRWRVGRRAPAMATVIRHRSTACAAGSVVAVPRCRRRSSCGEADRQSFGTEHAEGVARLERLPAATNS
jgi:hypothetical protein